MLHQSRHLRVTAEHGTATLWLGFPGDPPNPLDAARLRELDAAVAAVAAARAVRVLVVRSANPAGFCGGLAPAAVASLRTPADRAAFAWHGQQVLDRLARLDAATVAVIDGPCLGAGLELALACDYRVCVARPTTHLGFPDRFACLGGSARLKRIGRRAADLAASGRTLSGREARALGLVDVACCERRGKIELRTFLDRLEDRPAKRWPPDSLPGLAAERAAFAAAGGGVVGLRGGEKTSTTPPPHHPTTPPPLPDVVGLIGDDPDLARVVAEAVLRGGSAVACDDRGAVFAGIDAARARGFVTPLEAEQARGRVRATDFARAGLVLVSAGHDPRPVAAVVRPRTVVCVSSSSPSVPHHRRTVHLAFDGEDRATLTPGPWADADTPAVLAAWLRSLGVAATVAAAAPTIPPWTPPHRTRPLSSRPPVTASPRSTPP
jgi:enoyl-CoA hydratase/carnithine racemase